MTVTINSLIFFMEVVMEAIVERCAGLDVHLDTVVACILYGDLDKKPNKEIKTFSTTTKGLLQLLDYLNINRCTHVAMESTGVYWKPVWNILESGAFELIIANAKKIKNVPGRKTDVKDSEWIASLLRCGLIEKSFVPPEVIRDLRDLTRLRKELLSEITRHKNRIHKVLQDANVKVSSVLSDVFGETGKVIINELISNRCITMNFVESLYEGRGKSRLKATPNEMYEALNGKIRGQHIILLTIHNNNILFLEKQIEEIEKEIDVLLQKESESIDILNTIPGINITSAACIIAEIGSDMSVFPTEKHLSSWAGLCPKNNESAGKKKRSSIKSGNPWLRSILCECVWASIKKKDSRFKSKYWSMVPRMGKKKALIAIANLLLRLIYHLLKNKNTYEELEIQYYVDKDKIRENKIIKELKSRGYIVQKCSLETI